jgi:hypothetical protein
MHNLNKAEISTITFIDRGLQLLTFHHNKGNNYACFELIFSLQMPQRINKSLNKNFNPATF